MGVLAVLAFSLWLYQYENGKRFTWKTHLCKANMLQAVSIKHTKPWTNLHLLALSRNVPRSFDHSFSPIMMLVQLNSQPFKGGYIWRTALTLHLLDRDAVMSSFHAHHSSSKRQNKLIEVRKHSSCLFSRCAKGFSREDPPLMHA